MPLETRSAVSYILAFDNTSSLARGLAIAKLAAESANVAMIIRDDAGVQIRTATIGLAAQ